MFLKGRIGMRHIYVFSFCALVLSICGCGSDGAAGRKTVYPVTGVVKLNGAPVIGAFVSFTPMDGQPAATSRTNDNGEYNLTTYESGDGAAVGNYSVVVLKFDTGSTGVPDLEESHSPDGSEPMDSGHGAKGAKQADAGGLLPLVYSKPDTTTLKAVVSDSGDNTFDFELK